MVEKIVVKVANKSIPGKVAGFMASQLRHGYQLDILSIGRQATRVAVLATTITRKFVQPIGIDLVCVPEIGVDHPEAMVLHLVDRFDTNHKLPAPEPQEEGE